MDKPNDPFFKIPTFFVGKTAMKDVADFNGTINIANITITRVMMINNTNKGFSYRLAYIILMSFLYRMRGIVPGRFHVKEQTKL